MGTPATWQSLTTQDRFRLVACASGLLVIHASLALFGYGRTLRMIEYASRRGTTHVATAEQLADAMSLARLARIAGRRGMVAASCLRQSLLLHGWLRLRGFQTTLQLGVKKSGSGLDAHAWVELEGTRLLPSDEGYSPFVGASR